MPIGPLAGRARGRGGNLSWADGRYIDVDAATRRADIVHLGGKGGLCVSPNSESQQQRSSTLHTLGGRVSNVAAPVDGKTALFLSCSKMFAGRRCWASAFLSFILSVGLSILCAGMTVWRPLVLRCTHAWAIPGRWKLADFASIIGSWSIPGQIGRWRCARRGVPIVCARMGRRRPT